MTPEENIPLSEHTTFKIGGKARYFFRVKKVEEAREALGFARQQKLPFFVLGGGSNLLAGDSGFEGVIIKNEIPGLVWNEADGEVFLDAGAGENWDKLVGDAVKRNLYGLENLSGIPGTAGAAPVQNIGAYGVEVGGAVVSVATLDSKTGEIKTFNNADCRFGYRDSFFKTPEGKNFLIVAVRFRLKKLSTLNLEYKDLKNYFSKFGKAPTLSEVREAVLEIRRGKFPDLKIIGTAGSFFKNPVISKEKFEELKKQYPELPGFPAVSGYKLPTNNYKLSLAWILDNVCKLKGFHLGQTALFERQPIVVVNNGGATAENIQALAKEVVANVKEKTGIEVEWEVERL